LILQDDSENLNGYWTAHETCKKKLLIIEDELKSQEIKSKSAEIITFIFGTLGAVALTIYTSAVDDPHPAVTGGVGAVTAASFTTNFSLLFTDKKRQNKLQNEKLAILNEIDIMRNDLIDVDGAYRNFLNIENKSPITREEFKNCCNKGACFKRCKNGQSCFMMEKASEAAVEPPDDLCTNECDIIGDYCNNYFISWELYDNAINKLNKSALKAIDICTMGPLKLPESSTSNSPP
jgi:hypothetical protein